MEVNPDLFALPGMDVTSAGLSFNLGRALPVTVYVCPNCGRFKFMSAIFLGNIESPEPPQQMIAAEPAVQQIEPKQAETPLSEAKSLDE